MTALNTFKWTALLNRKFLTSQTLPTTSSTYGNSQSAIVLLICGIEESTWGHFNLEYNIQNISDPLLIAESIYIHGLWNVSLLNRWKKGKSIRYLGTFDWYIQHKQPIKMKWQQFLIERPFSSIIPSVRVYCLCKIGYVATCCMGSTVSKNLLFLMRAKAYKSSFENFEF